jgi:hypothetical protein
LQDIELARISQEVTERFYNLLAVGDGGRRTLLVPLGADTSQQSFLRHRSTHESGPAGAMAILLACFWVRSYN